MAASPLHSMEVPALRKPNKVAQELKPEIEHSSHGVANEVISVLDQQAEGDVVSDLRAHLVLHRVDGLLRGGVQEDGGIHLVGAQELFMCGVHFCKGSLRREIGW